MKNLFSSLALAVTLGSLLISTQPVLAQGTAFTYQGQLQSGGALANGTYDLAMALYATNTGGNPIAGPVTNLATPVSNGLFIVTIDFGSSQWNGETNWLDIAVRTNGSATFTELTPRQEVTPAPYAIFATGANNLSGTVLAEQVSGTVSNLPSSPTFSGTVTANALTGNGAGVTNVNAASLNGLNATNFWQLAGNNVVIGNFLGSTNFQPVEVWVNSNRAFRLEPTTNNSTHTNIVNVVGGSSANYVKPGTYGAVIAGGGAVNYDGFTYYSNSIAADMSSIGGGYYNSIQTGSLASVIAGGYGNSIGTSAEWSVIGGGYLNSITTDDGDSTIAGGTQNTISAPISFIGGGSDNSVLVNGQSVVVGGEGNNSSAPDAFIGGGYDNSIGSSANSSVLVGGYINTLNALESVLVGGFENVIQLGGNNDTLVGGYQNYILANTTYAFLGGGYQNTNSGNYSVVVGGLSNYAAGAFSFAAGQRAQALNQGTFVWADSQGGLFTSSASNQFLIRAQGGVGINKNNPAAALDVSGTINGTLFTGNGGGLTNLQATNLTGIFPLSALPATVVTNDETGVILSNLNIGGTLNLPSPAIITYAGGTALLYADLKDNFFAGPAAGNQFLSGSYNTGIGTDALNHNTTGGDNTAIGSTALYENTTGINNAAVGASALYNNQGGSSNVAVGFEALGANTNSFYNTAIGTLALAANVSGLGNTAVGDQALQNSSGGTGNIALGYFAGANYTGSEDNNIDIGYAGVLGENNVTHIGYAQTDSFIAGTVHAYAGLSLDINNANIGTISNTALTFGNSATPGVSGGEGIASKRTSGGTQDDLEFYTDYLLRMQILNNGTVGIVGELNLDSTSQNTGTVAANALVFGNGSGEGIASKRIGGNSDDLEFYTGFNQQMTILHNGNVGIGTDIPTQALEVNGEYIQLDNEGGTAVLGCNVIGGVTVGSLTSGYEQVSLYNNTDNAYMDLSCSNINSATITCSSITITGGSDLAEPFQISNETGEAPKGSVMVIDEQNPGRLKLSSRPYDTRVAGVLSGAGGIQPGLRMQQQGVLEGGQNVALSGRVYVQADAGNGPIQPGDLLTTSSTPGHAMKVTDHTKAQGAILGKAMTGLNEGSGMVLVLVTLQ